MMLWWRRLWTDYFKPIDEPLPRRDPLPDYTGEHVVIQPPRHVPHPEVTAFLAEKPAKRTRKKPVSAAKPRPARKPRKPVRK